MTVNEPNVFYSLGFLKSVQLFGEEVDFGGIDGDFAPQ